MSLSTKQSIQVVTKIWGWYKAPQGWYDGDFKIDQLNYAGNENWWIQNKVNSWEGFGKTMEAMARRDRLTIKEFANPYTDYLRSRISEEELFERIQLAALKTPK